MMRTIFVRDNLENMNEISEYEVAGETTVEDFVAIIQSRREIQERFRLCASGEEVKAETPVGQLMDKIGKIPLSIELVTLSQSLLDQSLSQEQTDEFCIGRKTFVFDLSKFTVHKSTHKSTNRIKKLHTC